MTKRNHIQFLLDDTELKNLKAISEGLDVPVSVNILSRNAVRRYIKDYMAKAHERTAADGTGINADLNAMVADWE
jgi:hypothetical protein